MKALNGIAPSKAWTGWSGAAARLEIEGAESKDPSDLAGLALRLEKALDGVKAALKSVIAETGRPVECNGALLLRLKRSTAYELVRRGEIPAIRLNRFIRVPARLCFPMGKDFDAAVGNSKNTPPPSLR